MVERRDVLRCVGFGAAIAAARSVSACISPQREDDHWGARLVDFFRTGSTSELDDLFSDFTTFVTFDDTVGLGSTMLFKGANDVRDALVSLRTSMTRKFYNEPRTLIDAKIVGPKKQGDSNLIELLFAEGTSLDTSCGPDRFEIRTNLYYRAGVYEAGEYSVKWGIERLALMPYLQTEPVSN